MTSMTRILCALLLLTGIATADDELLLTRLKVENAILRARIAELTNDSSAPTTVVQSDDPPVEDYPSPCVLFFTQRGCDPCVVVKDKFLPWLKTSKWNTLTIDITDGSEVGDKFGITATPTLVVIHDKREKLRYSGTDLHEFAKLLREKGGAKKNMEQDKAEAGDPQAPTPIQDIRDILATLNIQENETVVDYGCGDGRVLIEAAKTHKCQAIGIELDPETVSKATHNVAAADLASQVSVMLGDARKITAGADVGFVYLYPELLAELRTKLTKLDRFASYMHPVPELPMRPYRTSSGSTFYIWTKEMGTVPNKAIQDIRQHGAAIWGGQTYTGPVCTSPNCRMCNSIRYQLAH